MKTTCKLFIFVFSLLALAASAFAADDSPLHSAARYGDTTEIKALVANGADVNAKGAVGETPLHRAASYGKKDNAELLLAKGADINAMDDNGYTPLIQATRYGQKDMAELLLAKGADNNAKDNYGEAPLDYAAAEGEKDVAELLLAKGTDVNAKRKDGKTPLHTAAAFGNRAVAELLLAKGADINAKDNDGKTPLDMATSGRKKDVAELLKEQPVKQARLQEHIKSNPRAAFLELTVQLKDKPSDTVTRRLIIKLASELKPAPAIPEEARKHFVEGTAIVKAAKNPAQQTLAAQSFTEALKVAPWWGDAYYNLGVAQELAEKYDEAEQAFNFYLLSNPGATEKREVQDRIYALSTKRKLAGAK